LTLDGIAESRLWGSLWKEYTTDEKLDAIKTTILEIVVTMEEMQNE